MRCSFIVAISIFFAAVITTTSWKLSWLLFLVIIVIALTAAYEWTYRKNRKYIYWKLKKTHSVFIKRLYLILPFIGISVLLFGIITLIKPQHLYNRIHSISLNTSELQERFAYYRDSVEIIKDFPLLGTGFGGWSSIQYQYQTSLYSTRFVHSSLIQAALDYGLIGFIIFIAQISLFLYYGLQSFKKSKYSQKAKALTICMFLSGLTIILHSLLDLDLSFPVISLLLWISIAFLSKVSGNIMLLQDMRKSSKIIIIGTITLLILAQAPAFLSAYYYKKGMSDFNMNRVDSAYYHFKKSANYLPFSSNAYYMSGRTLEILFNKKPDTDIKELVIQNYNLAQKYDKYNPRTIAGRANLFKASGDYPNSIKELKNLIEVQPFVISYYESLADAIIQDVEIRYHKGNTGISADIKDALTEVIELDAHISDASNKFSSSKHSLAQKSTLKLTPSLALNIAKAYYLLGKLDEVEGYLQIAAQEKKLLSIVNDIRKGLEIVR